MFSVRPAVVIGILALLNGIAALAVWRTFPPKLSFRSVVAVLAVWAAISGATTWFAPDLFRPIDRILH